MCHAQNMAGHPSHGNPYMRGIKSPGLMTNPHWEKIPYPTNSTMAAMAPLPSAGTSVLLSPGSTWPVSTPPFFHGDPVASSSTGDPVEAPSIPGPSCARSPRPDVHGSEESGWDSFHPGANKDI